MARGGRRSGAPGALYGNRSDLNTGPRQLSIARIPGQAYGDQAAQVAAQRAVPVVSQPPLVPPSPAATAGPPAQPLPPLSAPTAQPNVPVTAGSPTGPGPGLEALGPLPQPTATTSGLIAALAQRSTSPELAALAGYVNAGRG